jgi:hypothetical protein
MGATGNWVARLGSWSLAARATTLILVALLLLFAVSPFAHSITGARGVVVSVCALAACLGGMLSALIAGDWLAGDRWMLANVGVGMVLRMGIPFGTFMAADWAGGPLAEGGFGYNLLAYYPALLAAETVLTVARVQHLRR